MFATALEREEPNILMIAIDDQNDWIGYMGGHPLVKTPHMVASQAWNSFTNAHCQSPLATLPEQV